MNKTVVELDLVGYSTICANFEQGLDVNSVAQLNGQIQSFVDAGLAAVNAVRREHVMQTTGDGAIVVFDSGSEAHKFAQAVNDATRAHNRSRQQHLAKRVFRMGAASGDIVMQETGSGYEIAGMTIARAVRLEAKAQPGGILVDQPTFEALSEEQKQRYASKEIVAGKRDEEFEAYACQLNPDGPKDSAYFISRNDALKSLPSSVPEESRAGSNNADISRIDKYAPAELIGRENELEILSDAWQQAVNGQPKRPHILTFVALGGEGKTSLVAKWAADLAYQGWPGCDAVFAWSFYSQGTRDQLAASSDLFLKEALTFFGDDADKQFAASSASAFEKGQRLARIVGQRRSLLILDGLEPLQYPSSETAFKPGELKDQGIAKLLKDLASTNRGLCIVTTRIELPDLQAFKGGTLSEIHLKRLSRKAGVDLLKRLGVKGSERRNIPVDDDHSDSEKVNEFEKLVEDVKGHALTLTLLGGFLKRAFHGDIRQRDRVKFEDVDEINSGHAYRTIAAYEQWLLRDGGDEGRREVAVLRLMGLFDRPADAGCLAALRSETIPGLTEPFARLADDDWEYSLSGLEAAKLLTVNRDESGTLVSLDAHPQLREYFARQLRAQQPGAWRAAHRRLYEHLCATTKEGDQPTLEDLQPLYQAVAHGCQARVQPEVLDDVFIARIRRWSVAYSTAKLGAFGADLAALACFFEQPWRFPSRLLTETQNAWLLNQTAYCLSALGRLPEALEPLRAALEIRVKQQNWRDAAISGGNLSELGLTLGNVNVAVRDAEQAVSYADRSGDAFARISSRCAIVDALHQEGHFDAAEARLTETEEIHSENLSAFRQVYALRGFRYCELLLSVVERGAWHVMANDEPFASKARAELVRHCRVVIQRARELTSRSRPEEYTLLDIALSNLMLARGLLCEAVLEGASLDQSPASIQRAMDGLRRANVQRYILLGLLTRSWFRHITGAPSGPESAQEDLDEAWEIAERGPMRLMMADVHLYRARLFGLQGLEDDAKRQFVPYPWATDGDGTARGPKDDLAAARRLIEQCGYWRRKEELEDAEEFLRTPSNQRQANESETDARALMSLGKLQDAREKLLEAIEADPARESRISDEFGFAFSVARETEAASPPVKQDSEALTWRTQVWSVLAKGSNVRLERSMSPLVADTPEIATGQHRVEPEPTTTMSSDPIATAEQKGEILEQAVSRLFRTFFRTGDETPWKIRTQRRGTQHGFDLSIEWSGKCEVAIEQPVRVHIECKNYTGAISHNEVGGKLLMERLANPPVIEHWILISPHTDPNNDLNRFLESEQKSPTYPFGIQVWSPESGVIEFFGLEPDVYDQFYVPTDGLPHPRTWDDAKRDEVRRKWMARLAPRLRLPEGWVDYLRDPARLCSPPEAAEKFQEAYENYVAMRCRNTAGALLEKPLSTYVEEWLNQKDKGTLFLLGEFGDGKTCFTYVFARHLAAACLEKQDGGWLPLRLTLKKYPGNARDFLRQRLEEFKADVSGWIGIGNHWERMVILDGFDEMSVSMAPAAVTKNIGDLLACVKEFKDCKILITSRTHFFENRQDAKRLMARLGDPTVYYLAPIEREEALRSTERHLASIVGPEQARERISRIDQLNDPIGLARKPLFLEMLKVVLSSPEVPNDLGVYDLYESYINQSLERNDDRLDDEGFLADPSVTIPNMRRILGELAEELQRSGRPYVSLNRFQTVDDKPFAELLWKLSGGAEMEKDARTRVGARSLLGRVQDQQAEDEWLVDFCHRSMREYFVAIRLCDSVEAGLETGLKYLKEVPLNHEILEFAVERWRRADIWQISERLLQLIERAKPANSPGTLGGHSLTLLYRLNPKLPRDRDWRGKVFDGADLEDADLSGMDFSACSFVAANFANVNFENAIFAHCDLTSVRLEETKSVVSLAASPSGEELIALYGDGILREWQAKSGSKMSSRILGAMKSEVGSVVGVHESGQAWLRHPREWAFLSQGEQGWQAEGVFAIKDGYDCIYSEGGRLTFSRRIEHDCMELTLVDLESLKIIAVRTVGQTQWCAALEEQAFVWSDSAVGLRVGRIDSDGPGSELILEMPQEPTCLDTWRCDSREYLVAAGMGDGKILAWRLDLKAAQWRHEKILETRSHDGAVTALAFTNAARIASGGADRAICLTRLLGPRNLIGTQERRLQRTLHCRGMKIDGVKGPAEYEMLRGIIAHCEEEV